MNRSEFENVVDHIVNLVSERFNLRNEEYGAENDIFRNFIEAAEERATSKEDALEGMAVKHTISINDMVKDPEVVTQEMVDEKIIDRIVYYCVLYAMFIERIENEKNISYAKDCLFDVRDYLLGVPAPHMSEPMREKRRSLLKSALRKDNFVVRKYSREDQEDHTKCPCTSLNVANIIDYIDKEHSGFVATQTTSYLRIIKGCLEGYLFMPIALPNKDRHCPCFDCSYEQIGRFLGELSINYPETKDDFLQTSIWLQKLHNERR